MSNTLLDLRRFLDAACHEAGRRVTPSTKTGLYPFVTISRQYGAGGLALAGTLARLLQDSDDPGLQGWKVFDRKLCEEVVSDRKLKNALESAMEEEYHTEIESLVLSLLGTSLHQQEAVQELFEVIRTLATFGKVIIVGGAGACVTQSLPLGVHVRLVASAEDRLKRAFQSDAPDSQHVKVLRQRDRAREKFVWTYFHSKIENQDLYDTIWNTSRVSLEVIAKALMAIIKARRAHSPV